MQTHRILVTVLLLCSPLVAQTNADAVRALVASRFESTQCPGLSVSVAQAGRIIASVAMGSADLELNAPLRSDSVHRLGSLSKPITGVLIMDLVDQGKLELDASVRKYLPELPEHFAPVTLRQLLAHQSGVHGYRDPMQLAFSTVHYPSQRSVLSTFTSEPLRFAPGTKVEYESLSFTIAGAAAESVTGKTFDELAAEFFARNKLVGFGVDNPYAVVPRRVRGYLIDPKSRIHFNDGSVVTRDYLVGLSGVTNARSYDISNRYPAGGFLSSTDDLLRFTIAVGDGRLLRSSTVKELWRAQTTADGKPTPFGIGWGVSQWNGQPMVGLNGAEPSTTAFLRYLPGSGDGVVLACNAEGAQGLPELLADLLRIVAPAH